MFFHCRIKFNCYGVVNWTFFLSKDDGQDAEPLGQGLAGGTSEAAREAAAGLVLLQDPPAQTGSEEAAVPGWAASELLSMRRACSSPQPASPDLRHASAPLSCLAAGGSLSRLPSMFICMVGIGGECH